VVAEARALLCTGDASRICANDPRLGRLIRKIDSNARDARDLAERLLRDAPQSDEVIEGLRELCGAIAMIIAAIRSGG
jgi:hypothetical protein